MKASATDLEELLCRRCGHPLVKHHVLRQPTGDCSLCAPSFPCELTPGTVLEFLQELIRADGREATHV